MFRKFICIFIVLSVGFFMFSCGDDGSENVDESGTPDQEEFPDEDIDIDEIPDEEILPEYPKVGVTSNNPGDTAHNLYFMDREDKELTLGHFYKKKKLIWLIFSTYDCPACNLEKKDIPLLNKADYKDRGLQIILIMNGLLSGPQPDKEPGKVANMRDIMISSFGDDAEHVYGYLTTAQQTTFRRFIKQGYPVNIFIDGNTMEIMDHWEGWDPNGVTGLDNFINFILEEL